jgi:TatD DNase family protein
MRIVDSHCHLDDPRFAADREAVLDRAWAAGLVSLLAIGTGEGPPDFAAGIRLAEADRRIYATVGVHPHHAGKVTEGWLDELRALGRHPRVVALGEMGLDFHYHFSSPEAQREVFLRQLELAAEERKPVVIHTREAWAETIALLKQVPPPAGGVFHCFSGGPAEAEEALELGFHLGLGGVVTFPKAGAVREAARRAPLDRLLLETDAPYLAPVPHRGKRNEPAFAAATLRRLAEERQTPVESLAEATTANFERLCLRYTR